MYWSNHLSDPQDDWRNQFGPDGLRGISLDELDDLAIDKDGRLHWRGHRVSIEQKISLRRGELALAVVVAIATVVQAIVAVIDLGLGR